MPDMAMVARIYVALVVCFLMGLFLGLLIWFWRRQAERAETERIRMESEAQGHRLKLRITALGEAESKVAAVEAELAALKGAGDGTADDGTDDDDDGVEGDQSSDDPDPKADEIAVLTAEVAALQSKVDESGELEQQIAGLKTEVEKGRRFQVETKDLRERTSQLEVELAGARNELEAARTEVERYSDKLSETEQEVAALKLAAPSSDDGDHGRSDDAGQSAAESDESELTVFGTAVPQRKDDLKKISGIGPALERTLNGLGIQTWDQIANLTSDEIEQVQDAMGSFKGRMKRDDWVGGARKLIAEN